MAVEKFGYFRLSEGTEGEDESLSSGWGWFEVLLVTTDCCGDFFCKESGKLGLLT